MKTCSKCAETKPLTGFAQRARAGDGRSSWCLACLAAYGRQRYAEKKDQIAERWRETRYGVTPARWEQLLSEQGHACAICRTDTPGGQGAWHIDHDHACCPAGKACVTCVRGLLCHNCNTGLGRFADDPTRLRAAIDYLNRNERRAA